MKNSKIHIRHCLLYEFQLGHSASQATSNICRALGPGTISQPTAHRWFKRFSSQNYDLEDEPRSERSDKLVLDGLKELVERDPRQTIRCLASTFGCSHTTIERRLSEMGYRSMLGGWVPHDLTWSQQNQRIDICTNLLSLRRTYQWIDHLITGDEKWILYTNITKRLQWVGPNQAPLLTAKPELHEKKIMLSVWWDVKGVVYWELLPSNTTITAEVYCLQLENLKLELETHWPGHGKVYFLHDNARPHVAKSTRKKLLDFGSEVLPHPPYSPDLAPSDYYYYLFRSLNNSLRGKKFDKDEDIFLYLKHFFASHPNEILLMCHAHSIIKIAKNSNIFVLQILTFSYPCLWIHEIS